MNRTDIINSLIRKINAKSYLEIGVCKGKNIFNILCEYKVGVDPSPKSPANFYLTSDEFFEMNQQTFDIIFVDGLHISEQVTKDLENSLKILNDDGYIVCHDMNPWCEEVQRVPYMGGEWTGDCWKSFVKLRQRSDLEMFVVDCDCGCGVIKRGNQTALNINIDLNYENLSIHRKEWLNLITPEEFEEIINEC